ncbi:MAG: hypothetical protein Q9217_006585, partial [Psora testacea]
RPESHPLPNTVFGDQFSRAAVALTAGIIIPIPNMLEQSRNNIEVFTRVPEIPLFVLIGLKLVYALASLVVAALAYLVTKPNKAQEVKARLTIDGLATGLVEPGEKQERAVRRVREIFGEHRLEDAEAREEEKENAKVDMKQTENGRWVRVAGGAAQRVWATVGFGDVIWAVRADAIQKGEFGSL